MTVQVSFNYCNYRKIEITAGNRCRDGGSQIEIGAKQCSGDWGGSKWFTMPSSNTKLLCYHRKWNGVVIIIIIIIGILDVTSSFPPWTDH